MIQRMLTWRVYLYFLYALNALSLIGMLSIAFFTHAWSGTDGGLGMVAWVFWAAGLALASIMSRLVQRWMSVHTRFMRVYLIVFWIAVFVAVILTAYGTVLGSRKSTASSEITAALQQCGVSEVRWTYSPTMLTIRHKDGSVYEKAGWTDPAFVESAVQRNRSRCDADYPLFMNGVEQP
jgi:uncharacterized membrane protein